MKHTETMDHAQLQALGRQHELTDERILELAADHHLPVRFPHEVVAFARAITASPEQAAPVVATCRDDDRCQYAIDHGAEGMAACPAGKCCMAPAPSAETISTHPVPAAGLTALADSAKALRPRLQSFLDRLCSDTRSATMFEGDGDALREAMDLCWHLSRAIAQQPAPAAGLTDAQAWQIAVDLFGTTLRDTRHPAHVEITNAAEAGEFARAILAQQPAQAVAAKPIAWVVECLVSGEWVPQYPARFTREQAEEDASMYGQTERRVTALIAAPLATHEGKAGGVETPEIVVIAAARALADRHAAACNVDKDDNWKIYGDEFIADARAALAAMQAQQAGKAGA